MRNLLGESRTSRDFDVVVRPAGGEDAFRRALEREGYEVDGPLKADLGRRLVVDLDGYSIDLWLASRTELHDREFDRIQTRTYRSRELPIIRSARNRRTGTGGRLKGRDRLPAA